MRPSLRILPVALAVLALAACGGGGGGAPSGSAAPTGESPGASPAAALPLDSLTQVKFPDGAVPLDGFRSADQGDFNGDGRADLLIGASTVDPAGKQDAGEALVVFGDISESRDLQARPADVVIQGRADGDNLGTAVLSIDLNQDGIDDIAVSSPGVTLYGSRNERTEQGQVYVFYGSKDLSGTKDIASDKPDFTVTGAEGFGGLGDALLRADVNADGHDDLVIGAPFAGREPGTEPGSPRKESGEVYVIFSRPGPPAEMDLAFDQPDWQISADQRYSQFGAVVAAGDVNGDGSQDLVIGAPLESTGDRATAGAVYVFFGGSGEGGRKLLVNGDQDAKITGAETGDAFGQPLLVADFNGDGADDILAGARRADAGSNLKPQAGEAYVLPGGSGIGDRDLASDPAPGVIYGAFPGASFPTDAAFADGKLFLSAVTGPSTNLGAGSLFVIDPAEAANGHLDVSTLSAALSGAEKDDHLGGVLVLTPDGRTLLVTSGGGAIEGHAGRVYLLPVSQAQASG